MASSEVGQGGRTAAGAYLSRAATEFISMAKQKFTY